MPAARRAVLPVLRLLICLLFQLASLRSAVTKAMPKPIGLYNFSWPYGFEDRTGIGLPMDPAFISKAYGPYGDRDGASLFIYTPIQLPGSDQIDTRYSITALIWIRQETAGPIFQYDNNSLKGVHFWFRTPTELYLQIPERGTAKTYGASTYSNLTTNTWHHVGFTYDYSTGLQRLYVNGTKVAEKNIGTHEIATNYELRFGKNYGVRLLPGGTYGIKARMYCFQLYDQALSPDQVNAARDMCIRKELFRQCFNYKILKSFLEAKSHNWYYFKGKKAKKIRSSCPLKADCQVWINGTHPSRAQGTVEHELCFRGASGCCEHKARVEVRQCYGYNVYKFMGLPPRDAYPQICLETDSDMFAPDKIFEQRPGYRLTSHVIHTETDVPSSHECMGYCLVDDKRCKSVNYSARENRTCQLNNATATEFDGHLSIQQTGWEYYQPSDFITVV
ncbi:uncharacterized protein LOC116605921 [Nematostella vectensis]|uniref:uncharacterized protein LOC116605921 n=1 Tax=Nematostella vectensis TaxID=45351 RepID=UPI0020778D32|nr:uncharacterized protein LOC116605921 [Nematostella vectensis]